MSKTFTPVSLEGRQQYYELWGRTPQRSLDYTLANLWGWQDYYGLEWCFEDNLCWIRQTRPYAVCWAPVGDWNEFSWKDLLPFGFNPEAHNITRVPEKLLEIWQRELPGLVDADEDRGQWEYLYKQEELAEAFEASRIPIREAFQILENQGLIIRLATRRITVTELDEEQICLIYSMISEMTKKALNSLKHSKKTEELYERLTTPGLLGEVQPAEAMCDLVENEYIKRLLRNASDSYIRFALSTGRHKEEIKEERNKLTELLKNGELKKAEKALDAYFKLLAKAVNEERGMNE